MKPRNVSISQIGQKHLPSIRAQIMAKPMRELEPEAKPSKYKNVRCEADGIKFDSLREREVYFDLKTLQRAGKISGLEVHPRYSLDMNGDHIGFYTADFRFLEPHKGSQIWDVKGGKGTQTTASRLRIRCFQAIYKLRVVIVT